MDNYSDIRTILLFSGFIFLTLGVSYLYIVNTRKRYAGYFSWPLGALSVGIGFVLLSFRDLIPDFFSIIIANTLTMLYPILIYRGLYRFCYNTSAPTWIWYLLLVHLILFGIFTYIVPDISFRIATTSILYLPISLHSIFISIQKLPEVMGPRIISIPTLYTLFLSGFLIRGMFAFAYSPETYLEVGILEKLLIQLGSSINIFLLVAHINLINIRMEKDLCGADEEIDTLREMLPICASCKNIRDDEGYWKQLEHYFSTHKEIDFSHSICPSCASELYGLDKDEIAAYERNAMNQRSTAEQSHTLLR